jgi:hypothetical protein
MIFILKFYTLMGFIIGYLENFVSYFFETLKYEFYILKNKRIRVVRSMFIHAPGCYT